MKTTCRSSEPLKCKYQKSPNEILSMVIYNSQKDSQIDKPSLVIFTLCTERCVEEYFGCFSNRNYFLHCTDEIRRRRSSGLVRTRKNGHGQRKIPECPRFRTGNGRRHADISRLGPVRYFTNFCRMISLPEISHFCHA